jgi:hypothetical protein
MPPVGFLSFSMYTYCCPCILRRGYSEVFPCFFLVCKANAGVKLVKTGHGPHSSNCCVVLCIVCFVSFYVFFVCKCVLYYCHRVTTQLQLIYHNISYHLGRRVAADLCLRPRGHWTGGWLFSIVK